MPAVARPSLPRPAGGLRLALLCWYDRQRRRLPWRAEPGAAVDPYTVLLSEVMLQQTTVAAVTERFVTFRERFPSLAALAAAPLDEVLHAWQGLGYYRRARALHALAREVVDRRGAELPSDPDELATLPGIGPYTAAAVAAIAFERPVVPVDGNVARVLSRLVALERPLPAALADLRRLAAALADGARPGDLAQALMDLGATLCRPTAPDCTACPWQGACRAHAQGRVSDLPVRSTRAVRPLRHATAFLVRRGDGAVLLRRRPEQGLLAGLYDLPSTPWTGEAPWPSRDALAHAPPADGWRPLPAAVRHVFTHLTLEVRVIAGDSADHAAGLFVTPSALGGVALPTLTRKLLRHGGIRA